MRNNLFLLSLLKRILDTLIAGFYIRIRFLIKILKEENFLKKMN